MTRRVLFSSYTVLCCLLVACAGYLAVPLSALAGVKVSETIAAEQAQQHIGETNTVCGLVANALYMDSWESKPTFLNFDRSYPYQSFAVRIPDFVRSEFSEPPEALFSGKTVCVTGLIEERGGRPQIVVDDSSQIDIQETATTPAVGAASNLKQKTTTPPAPTITAKVRISSTESQQHIGETATVCGLVASARGFESSDGGRSYLNFDHPFPNQTLAVMIEGANRTKFKSLPEALFNGKTICVTGAIINYRGKPEIVVEDPSQIVVQQ
jgi:DNA/RNA endonuclease YhcR with UshA esterase domain